MDAIRKYNILPTYKLLEIGCGEGRDSRAILENGFSLMATDISEEAIAYCKKQMPQFETHFSAFDCLSNSIDYQFIQTHLTTNGIALICAMGNGEVESQGDISKAFTLQERNHESGKMLAAETSCRMVSFPAFEKELNQTGLTIIEEGITSSPRTLTA